MQDLMKQEQFELEVLDKMNSAKMLKGLIFGGGTMLRLCYGLNRFSVDLDFWTAGKIDRGAFLKDMNGLLASAYTITDAADKFNTLLFEFRSKNYPRLMKIEIRKEEKKVAIEQSIAFSRYSNTQVLLGTVSLKDMMAAKTAALLDRKEIRDAFDMEFLVKKGIGIEASLETRERARAVIVSFTKKDYTSKLGSLLEEAERKYYSSENFKILLNVLK
jgi:predicted nucleotidyltransferase component of viral defense system